MLEKLETGGRLGRRVCRMKAEAAIGMGDAAKADEAVQAFSKVVGRENGPLEYLKGRLADMHGDEAEAYLRLRNAARYAPDDKTILKAIAEFCKKTGRESEASQWRKLIGT